MEDAVQKGLDCDGVRFSARLLHCVSSQEFTVKVECSLLAHNSFRLVHQIQNRVTKGRLIQSTYLGS